MNWPIAILVGSQILFTTSDLIARYYMTRQGLKAAAFISLWFVIYMIIRMLAILASFMYFPV